MMDEPCGVSMKNGMRVNIRFAENGVICEISKEEEDEEGCMKYKEETMVFPSMEECTAFLKENKLNPKKTDDGKIMAEIKKMED